MSDTETAEPITWVLDEYWTRDSNQRVFFAEIQGYHLKASECLKCDEASDDLFALLPADVATPGYIVSLEAGTRLNVNDTIKARVVEIVEGFDRLTEAGERVIARWKRYKATLEAMR